MDRPTTEQIDKQRERNRQREKSVRQAEIAAQHPRALDVDNEMIQRREEIASNLLSFYELLTRLHIPAEALKRPPEGGWPFINAERFGFLGKTDAVIDLYKHIPYIAQEGGSSYEISPACICVDYTGHYVRSDRISYQLGVDPPEDLCEDEEVWPPLKELQHVAILARSHGGTEGLWMAVDTRDGNIAQFHSYPDISPSESNEKTAKTLFKSLKEDFCSLKCIALSPNEVVDEDDLPSGRASAVKNFYRKYGWPSDAFRKDDCMHAIQQALEIHDQKSEWQSTSA